MGSFEQLQSHVANGDMRLIHIDAVPRSFATVLGRALKEGNDAGVYVHEPYHTMGCGVDEASGAILSAAEPLLGVSGEPVTVITKSIARKIDSETFDTWMSICDGVLFSIRDPMVQVHSVLERLVHDTLVEPGAGKIFQLDALPDYGWGTGMSLLESGGTSRAYSKLGWRALQKHYDSEYKPNKTAVVDGTELIHNSESVLRSLCNVLNIPFRDRMIDGWREHNIINANRRRRSHLNPETDNSPTNGWIGHALYSSGIEPTERGPVDDARLRSNLRVYLTKLAVPIYERLRAERVNPLQPIWWPARTRKYHEPYLDEEVIEHKGIGHPDSLCDILSEEVRRAYVAYMYERVGGMPNGSSDKVAAYGGTAELTFGSSKITKDATFGLAGKAMAINGSTAYMEPLFRKTVDNVMHDVFGHAFALEGMPPVRINTVVNMNAGIGAEHDPAFYTTKKHVDELTDYRISNDTVACAGWYPLTPHEQVTVQLSNYLTGEGFKKDFPETGTDVKILTRRIGALTTVTLCVPFIAHVTPTESFYTRRKAEILDRITSFVTDRVGPKVQVHLNTKDVPGKGYLTVYGSALDKGDNGMTGRGNRYPGLIPITMNRPSGVEAFPGKNAFNHSGRIYTAMAFDLAKLVYETRYDTSANGVNAFITAQNGDRLGEPHSVTIQQGGRDVTSQYVQQIMSVLQNLNDPTYTCRMSAVEAFRSCYGLLDQPS